VRREDAVRLKVEAIMQSVIVALLLGVLSAAVSTYIEVKQLRRDVDRLEVYVQQLWEQR
jgi:predicted transcriptional regulator